MAITEFLLFVLTATLGFLILLLRWGLHELI